MRHVRLAVAVAGALAAGVSGRAQASITQIASGVSGAGVPVSMKATLTISGNLLTIELFNNSAGPSLNPADVLGSYYFDIVKPGNVRPVLAYQTAIGDVYLASRTQPDTLQTANANLVAINPGDSTWQFKTMNAALNPFLGFGVGTVGNSNLTPNNFMGNIVDGLDYSIYKGDVTTNNLNGRLLVKDKITFTFSGVSGFTEADISPNFAFGLGTAPDSLLTPEPESVILLAAGILALSRRKRVSR